MLSRIWFINAVLALFVVFFGFKAYGVWGQRNNGIVVPETVQKPARRIPKPVRALQDRKIPPESEYDVLMTLNLFVPERSEIIPKEPKSDEKLRDLSTVEEKKIIQYLRNLTLYGLVITNNSAEALVSHPAEKPVLSSRQIAILKNRGRSKARVTVRQTKWVKVGDTLGKFKVVSVKSDGVQLKAGGQSFDLLLYDKGKPKKRGTARPKTSPNVVGVSIKPTAGSQVAKVPVKSPVMNAKGPSTIPLPTKKEASGAAVAKTQKNQ